MRVSDKLALIDKIGRELQSRFTYSEIDAFLAEYEITPPPDGVGTNSKWVYSKAALNRVETAKILQIAEELELAIPHSHHMGTRPPRNWAGTSDFRLFISHISKDKDKAMRLKDCLAPYGVSGFVAHEDIHPTIEWEREIERALYSMDAFVAIRTAGFSASFWTQQEIGFAVGRGVKVISLRMGEDPTGFISKHQALSRGKRTAEQIAREIDSILSADNQTARRLLEAKKAKGLLASEADPLADDIPF
jgi:hypothetical protein